MIKGFFRDIVSQKGWLIAIILLVALSAGIYSSFRSIYDSAISSVDNANNNLNSAEVLVLTEPRQNQLEELQTVGGVALASSVFSEDTYTLENDQRVRGQVSSVPPKPRVDDYQIIDGRDASAANEVVVEHHYASRHQVMPGDNLTLYLQGKATVFTVAGIYFSPSNLYMVSPEGWIENDFGYFAVPTGALGNLVNEYRLTLADINQKDQTLLNLNKFFAEKNINAVVMATDATLAKTAFQEDASALNSLANLFTVILLFTSAFIFFIVLSRNVERKRREIGVYRAMGFSQWSIFYYFISFSLVAVIIGLILSLPIAYGLLVSIVRYWGSEVLKVPGNFLAYNLSPLYVGYSILFSLTAVLLAAAIPAWRAAKLKPSEAMKAYRASAKGSRFLHTTAVTVTKKLYLRDLFGHKVRNISTILGIALVLSIGLSFVLSMQSYVAGINNRFSKNEKWDIRIHFTKPQGEAALTTLRQLSGVKTVESYNGTSAEVTKGQKSVVIQLNEQERSTQLTDFSLSAGSTNTNGLIVSSDVAYRLHAQVGDIVNIITPKGKNTEPIAGIFNEFGSSEGYQLKDISRPSGALLAVSPDQIANVKKSLPKIGFVKSWVNKEELKDGWLTLFKEFQGFTVAMDMVTVILVLLIVGIFAFLAIAERRWEFVTLKLIGFSNRQIRQGALIENFFLAVIGALLGIPIGWQIATAFSATFQELMSPPPTILSVVPIVTRALLVIGITLATAYLITTLDLRRNVVERIRRLFGTT